MAGILDLLGIGSSINNNPVASALQNRRGGIQSTPRNPIEELISQQPVQSEPQVPQQVVPMQMPAQAPSLPEPVSIQPRQTQEWTPERVEMLVSQLAPQQNSPQVNSSGQQNQSGGKFNWGFNNGAGSGLVDFLSAYGASGNVGQAAQAVGEGTEAIQQQRQQQEANNATMNAFRQLGLPDDIITAAVNDPSVRRNVFNNLIAGRLNGGQVEVPKAEAGFVNVPDPTTPSGFRAVPITGSNADMKIKESELKASKEGDQTEALEAKKRTQAEYGIGQINNIRSILDGVRPVSGIGGKLADLVDPATKVELESTIDALHGMIGSEALAAAKAASPNGASGFGNLSNTEFVALANSIAAIKFGMSEDSLRRNLDIIEGHFNKAFGANPQAGTEQNTPVSSNEWKTIGNVRIRKIS